MRRKPKQRRTGWTGLWMLVTTCNNYSTAGRTVWNRNWLRRRRDALKLPRRLHEAAIQAVLLQISMHMTLHWRHWIQTYLKHAARGKAKELEQKRKQEEAARLEKERKELEAKREKERLQREAEERKRQRHGRWIVGKARTGMLHCSISYLSQNVARCSEPFSIVCLSLPLLQLSAPIFGNQGPNNARCHLWFPLRQELEALAEERRKKEAEVRKKERSLTCYRSDLPCVCTCGLNTAKPLWFSVRTWRVGSWAHVGARSPKAEGNGVRTALYFTKEAG